MTKKKTLSQLRNNTSAETFYLWWIKEKWQRHLYHHAFKYLQSVSLDFCLAHLWHKTFNFDFIQIRKSHFSTDYELKTNQFKYCDFKNHEVQNCHNSYILMSKLKWKALRQMIRLGADQLTVRKNPKHNKTKNPSNSKYPPRKFG